MPDWGDCWHTFRCVHGTSTGTSDGNEWGEAETPECMALLRAEYAALLAAARATVAAAQAGEADPAGYVRGVLAERGQLPPAGARPLHVVADARAALCLTGWPA